jgi:hypothetical protein
MNLTGTFSGTADVGVARTVSSEPKLPVLCRTAAEAANLLLFLFYIGFLSAR